MWLRFSLSAPDTDGTVGIRLLPGVVFDLTGNPCSGGVSPLCQIFNWRGFLVEPTNTRLYDGDPHTLPVLPDCGADNISYQWKWDDGAKGINDGPQTQNWVIDEITLSMAGTYWCEVTYDDTVYATTPATIEVEPPLEIITMPQGAEKEIGESHEFTIETVGGYAPLTYDWMKDSLPIPGAPDAPAYTLSNLTEEDSGYYWVTVYDNNTTEIRSLSARLLVGIDLPLTGLLGILATATTLLFVGISTIKPRRKT